MRFRADLSLVIGSETTNEEPGGAVGNTIDRASRHDRPLFVSIFAVVAAIFWVCYSLAGVFGVQTVFTPEITSSAEVFCSDPALNAAGQAGSIAPACEVGAATTSDYIVRFLAVVNVFFGFAMFIGVLRTKAIPQAWMFGVWCAVTFIITAFGVGWVAS